MRTAVLLVSVPLLAVSTKAIAQDSQSFGYDANGRLTTSTTTSGSVTRTNTYTLDKADNRTVVAIANGAALVAEVTTDTATELEVAPASNLEAGNDVETVSGGEPDSAD